ncbi:MAG: 3-oxoacyl-[acyl-carrier-protein] synthase 2 [Planctomycetota bacterium]|jgi:3-oxoacyl-[acyl-carrier-protein] synthase II
MSDRNELVITGVGMVTPIGIGREAFWRSLRSAASGVRAVPYLENTRFPVPFGGYVPEFDGKLYVQPRKALKVMCREIQFGFAAATLAAADAGLKPGGIPSDRMGVVYGSEMYYGEIPELEPAYRKCLVDGQFDFGVWGSEGMRELNPLWMLKYLPNMIACHVAISFDARGPNNSFTLGEASSLMALIEGCNVLRRGHADVMLIGGSGNRLNITPLMYRHALRLSHHAGDPADACRPFDARRDGSVNGEGAGALVLETRGHAEARGARILARLKSAVCTFEPSAFHGGTHSHAFERAIRGALAEAQLAPDAVGFVKANGLGTVDDDACEAAAIRATVGDTPVTAPKSLFGNLGAAAGIVETIAAVMALEAGEIPPTRNYSQPDPNCPVRVVHSEPQPLTRNSGLVLGASGTGQTIAAVLEAA